VWRDYLGFPQAPEIISERMRTFLDHERRALMDRRFGIAIWIGLTAYLLTSVEQWFTLHDLRVLTVQLAAEGVIITFAIVGMTAWGRTRRPALFHCGYALVLIVYEWSVCYKKAFTTIWGDGFTEAFGFYCLLIPVSVTSTVLLGVAALLLMSIPAAVFTGNSMAGVLSLIGNLPPFAILVGSRFVANRSWQNETVARRAEAEAMQTQADSARLQLDFHLRHFS
jgi:hypothetical protein